MIHEGSLSSLGLAGIPSFAEKTAFVSYAAHDVGNWASGGCILASWVGGLSPARVLGWL